MRPKEPNQRPTVKYLPDYLKDLNKSHNIFVSREYLQGLPVRPTKRKHFDPDRDKSSYSSDDGASFCTTLSNDVTYDKLGDRCREIIVLLLPLLLAATAAVVTRRKREVFPVDSTVSHNDASSTPTRRKKRKRKKGKSNTQKDNFTDKDTINVDLVQNSHEVSRLSDDSNKIELSALGQLAPTNGTIQCNDNLNATNNMVLLTNSSRATSGLCLSNFSIDQVAQIWEAKGLDRQKSLELAAHFEMKMLFFRELLHFLSTASFHFMKKIESMQSKSHEQLERHHKERMDAPHHETMLRHRDHLSYMLLKAPILNRCISIAIASKSYFANAEILSRHRFPSLKTILSQILSAMCPNCSVPSMEASQLSLMSLYAPSFWRSLTFQGVELVCICLCAIKIILYSSLLVFCRQYISKSLSCAIIAVFFIDWKNIFVLAIAVVSMHLILTLIVRRILDSKVEHVSTHEAAKYYEISISMCEVSAHILSFLVGFYFSF
ncbi:hypothetical protein HJC23_006385 [Cyclotella cryptica]|uniref:Uncharacterized protein n=1 Tax=Cyclotella cryptica TaxID=29204 RepID=A0ABD3Q522_9STRA|eukprot:CCRYP_008798-RA/>CCRYP_008798-RA protein AED:0.40 eAED:0.40 QI:0/-1/0/1/-1/1/1/0/490